MTLDSREWWWCNVNNSATSEFSIENLRVTLCAIMDAFPYHNYWEGDAGQEFDESPLTEFYRMQMGERAYLNISNGD